MLETPRDNWNPLMSWIQFSSTHKVYYLMKKTQKRISFSVEKALSRNPCKRIILPKLLFLKLLLQQLSFWCFNEISIFNWIYRNFSFEMKSIYSYSILNSTYFMFLICSNPTLKQFEKPKYLIERVVGDYYIYLVK